MLCMFDLPTLAFLLGQRFVVRHLQYDRCNLSSKLVLELADRCLRIFESVVKDGCYKDLCVLDASLVSQDVGECDWVIDIGRFIGVLSALVAMFMGRERNRFDECILRFNRLFHMWH